MKFSSTTFGVVSGDGFPLPSAPMNANAKAQTLDLTTVDASVSLVAGVYVAFADQASDVCVVGLGVTTAAQPPASGAPSADSILTAPAVTTFTFALSATTTVHARVLSGTATLRLVRVSP